MNRNEFQSAARNFRAGRISLVEFTEQVFGEPETSTTKENMNHESSDHSSEPGKFAMPFRPVEAHKGDFGRVLAIGGSDSMPGSIAMTSLAALRSGAGTVIALTPEESQAIVNNFSPCPMVVGVASKEGMFGKQSLEEIFERTGWADVVAIGPGMGRNKAGQKIMKQVYEKLTQPVVIDADGLNNLADGNHDLKAHQGIRVLTPHPGEFRRLTGTNTSDRDEMEAEAIELAAKSQITIVLKGHHTLVTDGTTVHRNESGNSGMATAGAGDVLTGVIASLLGQGLSPIDAATTGCYVHGLAGDFAAKRLGEISMIATDILDDLSGAFKTIAKQG